MERGRMFFLEEEPTWVSGRKTSSMAKVPSRVLMEPPTLVLGRRTRSMAKVHIRMLLERPTLVSGSVARSMELAPRSRRGDYATRGEWELDKKHGDGTFMWPDGAKYVGGYKHGHVDGQGTYTSAKGKTIQVDVTNGSWIDHHGDAVPCTQNHFEDALRHLLEQEAAARIAKLKDILPFNAHFPTDEVELLPCGIIDTFQVNLTQLECNTLEASIQGITKYCENVPLGSRMLQKVALSEDVPVVSKATPIVAPTQQVLESLALIFTGNGVSAAHTLVLTAASNDLVCGVVKAQFPCLARLVLVQCQPTLDTNVFLSLVAENKHIEEVFFDDSVALRRSSLELIRQGDFRHVSFPDVAEPEEEGPSDFLTPTPKAAARMPAGPAPLQAPLAPKEFVEFCKQQQQKPNATTGGGGSSQQAPFGLETAYGPRGPVVIPVSREYISRFQLLNDLVTSTEEEEGGGRGDEGEDKGVENTVPMDLDPAVSKDSVALAVHFASHHVTDELHAECEEAERRAHGEATGGGESGSATATTKEDVNTKNKEKDPPPPSYTWCAEFADFHSAHIQKRYTTSEKRVRVMCELMAVACYLNCPSLKRFLRAALNLEVTDELRTE